MATPTNADRAEWAKQSLEVFDGGDPDDVVTSIKDLITDLGHLLMEEGSLSVEEATGVVTAAIDMFEDEVAEDN